MTAVHTEIRSWGNVCGGDHNVVPLFWRDQEVPFPAPVLPFGTGRSYGDSCLNTGGTLLATGGLDRFLSFDPASGVLRTEAGATLEAILRFSIPHGFFVPVSLGTKLITVGGAIANDVHGKNHHGAGTFGCHVRSLDLLRSDGRSLTCSPTENVDLFRATIGGLGLTGLILSAEIVLVRIPSAFLDAEAIRFRNFEEYLALAAESDQKFEHTSAWADLLNGGKAFGRGIFLRGNFSESGARSRFSTRRTPLTMPFRAPNWLLNRASVGLFNRFYFWRQFRTAKRMRVHYDPFFFPLDVLHRWNQLYGKRGFFQYQFLLPFRSMVAGMEEVLFLLRRSSIRPFLTVFKQFGSLPSPGILSFPMEGITVALDFPNRGRITRETFDRIDKIVASHDGRLYPAKDARMPGAYFRKFFPAWREFRNHIDPAFGSDLWRRVTGGADEGGR
ncbi:MAG: FAD-binding oxidoreductase [Pseudomonadota bacterium]